MNIIKMKACGVNLPILITVAVTIVTVSCYSVESELTLTMSQKKMLDKFRDEISNELPHEYMKSEIYLVKWLRASNFDLKIAKARLQNNLHWRSENKMDDILLEDYSDFEKQYPFWSDGLDYEDRPVGTADISDWDFRKSVVAGKSDKLLRYILQKTEYATSLVRELQALGKNVTQITLIVNSDRFNLLQHGCIGCIPIYLNYILAVQNYYPGMVHKMFMINTATAFETVLRLVYPALTAEIRDILSLHGVNKKEWQKAVLAVIPPDQIRAQFGGTKPDDSD